MKENYDAAIQAVGNDGNSESPAFVYVIVDSIVTTLNLRQNTEHTMAAYIRYVEITLIIY